MTGTTEENTSQPYDQFAELEIDTIMQTLAHESASFKKLTGIARGLVDYTEFLIAQVNSLTEERDELEFKFEQRGRIMDGTTEDFKKLKSLLSKAEEENKELKEQVSFLIGQTEKYKTAWLITKQSAVLSYKDASLNKSKGEEE